MQVFAVFPFSDFTLQTSHLELEERITPHGVTANAAGFDLTGCGDRFRLAGVRASVLRAGFGSP
jgi:hypothetical protein